jgi:integrase
MGGVSGHVKLVARKRGEQWYAKYRLPDGRQVEKRLGPAWTGSGRPADGHFTRRLAEEALQAILTDARRGLVSGRSGATFRGAATEYLRYVEDVRQIGAKTVRDYRGVVDGYLLEEFGDTPIEKVTPAAIEAYRDELLDAGELSNRTIVRHLTVLHGIFKRAKRAFGLRENPASAELVERPRVVYTGEFDTFDRAEIERLAAAAESDQDAGLYRVAAFTGLRTGELFALRWECVDFVGGLLHVRRNYTGGEEKIPKGKRVRSVPMMADVVDSLARLKERENFTADTDLVFCSEVGAHLDYYSHLARYKDALARAGLRKLRFHDLRHAFGTAAITKLDPFAVQSYMGHQHYSTTQRYLHHKPRREDAAALAEAFRLPNHLPNSGDSDTTERNSEHPSVPETADRG